MKNIKLFHLALLVSTALTTRQSVFADSPTKVQTVVGQPRFLLPAHNAADEVVTSKAPSKASKAPSEAGAVIVQEQLARLISFRSNVLRTRITDGAIVGVQNVSPRVIAITGKLLGRTSVEVTTARFNGDKIGHPQLYFIEVVRSARPTLVPVDAEKIARLLGRSRPDGQQSFEQMLVEEIEKRDKRIKELENK